MQRPIHLAPASPKMIQQLSDHEIFVYGSNTEGRHGKGAAAMAMKFGAVYGQAKGRQGQTYAICTKDLHRGMRSISLDDIRSQIKVFLTYAGAHPDLQFLVTRFGCDLAGFTELEIGSLWVGLDIPHNVRLPQAFIDVIVQNPPALPTL